MYVGNLVTQDAWLYDVEGTYGIIGYGLNSPFWNQFIDPVTGVATYMIALADPDTTTKSNITLGMADTTDYAGMNSLSLKAVNDTGLYNYDMMGFGLVYSDNTSYFSNFSSQTNLTSDTYQI